jgi:hypothetical protein
MTRWALMLSLLTAACGGGAATQEACLACATQATCDPGAATVCSCAAGFTGDGTTAGTGCSDVDECAAGTAMCAAQHATCANLPGGFACGCAAGFAGDGTATGTGCSDVDECGAGTHACDPAHGTCANTDGGFTCGCAAGYTGDGLTAGTGCSDIDECAAGGTTCDNFTCTNLPGSYRCDGLYAIEPFDGVLARLDPKTFALLDIMRITSSGDVSGVTAMARHPTTGAVYAVAKVAGVTGRAFGTLDLATGVFTVISGVDRFASLEFLPDGTLYGVTGAGASVRKTLYTIDPATGVTTLVSPLGHGADGEVICYDSDAARMVHWTGSGGNVTMESFAMAMPLEVVPTATLATSEVFGCRYLGDHTFLVHDISSRVHLVNADGTVTAVPDAVGSLFNDVRATLPTPMAVPHTVRPATGPAAGGTTVTIRGIGLAAATGVAFGGVAAASFTVVDDTTITAVTPAMSDTAVDVTVTGPPYVARWPAAYTFVASLLAPRAAAAATLLDPASAADSTLVRKALRGRAR